jgi:hypothetical protein
LWWCHLIGGSVVRGREIEHGKIEKSGTVEAVPDRSNVAAAW